MSIFRNILFTLLLPLSPIISFGQEAPLPEGKFTIKTKDGDSVTGTVAGLRDEFVSLITEYGTIRIPFGNISAETRSSLGISAKVDIKSLQARVKELGELVTRLRDENAALRKQITSKTTQRIQPAIGSPPRPSQPAADGMRYKLSSTGKRHNSRCRYYGSKGRDCSASEGVACKICGG